VELEVTVFFAEKSTPVDGGRGVFLLMEAACDRGTTPWYVRTNGPRRRTGQERGGGEPGGAGNEGKMVLYRKEWYLW
jgi:hypothetical protein